MGVLKILARFGPFDIGSTRDVKEAKIVPNFTHPTIILSQHFIQRNSVRAPSMHVFCNAFCFPPFSQVATIYKILYMNQVNQKHNTSIAVFP
jgi:hypothetical protein